MRKYLVFVIAIGMVLAAGMFGFIKRGTYTDITKDENYLDYLVVAQLPEEFAEECFAEMEEALPDSAIVARVRVIDEIEHLSKDSRQKVEVVELFQGQGLGEGEVFYLYSNHWSVSIGVSPASIERGFVNVLNVGEEYLVFLAKQVEDLYQELPVYQLEDDFLVVPVFSYKAVENKVVPREGSTSYVLYESVKNNEFFGETEKTVEAWKTLKKHMLELYPKE